MVESKPSKKWEKVFRLSLELWDPPSESARRLQHEKIVDLDTDDPKLQFLTYHCFFTCLLPSKQMVSNVCFITLIYHQTCHLCAKPCPAVARKTRSAYELLNFVQHVREAPGFFRFFGHVIDFSNEVFLFDGFDGVGRRSSLMVFFRVCPFEIPVTTTHP